MTISFSQAFGAAGASSGGISGWFMPIFASRTITIAKAGKLRICVVGAGGSGAVGTNATGHTTTGGNSGPWGVKVIVVAVGDVLVITLGSGGVKPVTANTNGAAGGTTTVTLNGATILTVPGGEGGVYLAGAGTANAPVPAAAVVGADFWVAGKRAGSCVNNGAQLPAGGGAAVDILQASLGRSPDVPSGGAGRGGSIDNDTGAAPKRWVALMDFGWSTGAGVYGDPGVGAGTGSGEVAGPFGGGSGASATAADAARNGGIGGGGGGGPVTAAAGNGGGAYACLTFEPEV